MSSYLLSSYTHGSLTLKNRVVLAPLTRGRAGPSRVPNDLMQTYYEQRAGAGLIITEATAISKQGYGWNSAPGCYNKEQAEAWGRIVDGVHAKGGKIFLQLWHMGRQSHPSFHETNEVVSASAIKVPGEGGTYDANNEKVSYEVPRALETAEVADVVYDYKRCAEFAKAANFDGIEVHAANGYLIDQFLQSSTNIRTDKYGGSFENRFRFLREILDAVLEVYPSDRIGVRVSPNGVFGGVGSADNAEMFEYVAEQLEPYKLAYLHMMDGHGFGFHNLCRSLSLYDLKSRFKGPVIGNITYTKETAEGAIRSGAADLIAFGRPYMSNPDLAERFANNWPLSPDPTYSHEGWYGGPSMPADGYTDYPNYEGNPGK